jgi:hypothetical protein
MSHEWTMKFIEHRVADRRILRLIRKWLKAGVSEDGQWSETKLGAPQGAVASPLLANVYLHYVFDLWVEAWRKKVAKGDVIVVRYADDLVVGFQYRTDAEQFLREFRERLAKCRRSHQVVVYGALGIIFGPQIVTKAKHVGTHQFVHVRFLAGACEQTEFVRLATNCFLRAILDAQRFQVGIYGGANCYARIGGLFNSMVLGKDEPLRLG